MHDLRCATESEEVNPGRNTEPLGSGLEAAEPGTDRGGLFNRSGEAPSLRHTEDCREEEGCAHPLPHYLPLSSDPRDCRACIRSRTRNRRKDRRGIDEVRVGGLMGLELRSTRRLAEGQLSHARAHSYPSTAASSTEDQQARGALQNCA